MKFSWGKGIALTYILFVVLTLIFVVFSMTKNVDLVSPDYYEKEIKYQEQINNKTNTNNLIEKPIIDTSKVNNVRIIFPRSMNLSAVSGDINFYRPDDSKKDFKLPVKLDTSGVMDLDLSGYEKGKWKIQLNWTLNDKYYYDEKYILIK
jgi:hypothetical protein